MSMLQKLNGMIGRGQAISLGIALLLGLVIAAAAIAFVTVAVPDRITITAGPKDSMFERSAERYKAILERHGVTLTVLPSEGSKDNLMRLSNPHSKIDVGFVLSGEKYEADTSHLMSLGSVSYQPLMIFYRGTPKRQLLSDLAGQRIYVGQEGSGVYSLALVLLKANGIEPGGDTAFVESLAGDPINALLENEIDALFLMGESALPAPTLLRNLMHTPDIHLLNFAQADGYTRRFSSLNKLTLPKGTIDFGKNIPAEDTELIGPTVELVAKETLHPALSDLLLEAAREVHGTASIFKKRGEFPSPQEHDLRISPDATRYYTSGKTFLYRTFPYGVASMLARLAAFLLPLALFLIPAMRIAPAIYRWRMEARIYRWYRSLLDLERDAAKNVEDTKKKEELLTRLDKIEAAAGKIVVPAAFGDLFYRLREHICFVRSKLLTQQKP